MKIKLRPYHVSSNWKYKIQTIAFFTESSIEDLTDMSLRELDELNPKITDYLMDRWVRRFEEETELYLVRIEE